MTEHQQELLEDAKRRGFQPHARRSLGHMIHPDDFIDCCPFGVSHPIHTIADGAA